jgi:hypothetical protein
MPSAALRLEFKALYRTGLDKWKLVGVACSDLKRVGPDSRYDHRASAFVCEDFGEECVAGRAVYDVCGADAAAQEVCEGLELGNHAAGGDAFVDESFDVGDGEA